MGQFITLMFAAIRTKFLALYTRVKQMLTPAFWQILISQKILGFFKKIFDVRPKDASDYYTVFKWMISKKLALAIVVGIGLISAWYIWGLVPKTAAVSTEATEASGALKYKYSDMVLSNFTGQAQVISEKNYVAYIGALEKGLATGDGTLYGENKNMIYTGAFVDNKYNGEGRLYYENQDLHYAGDFKNNYFHGKGILYNVGGVLKYSGEFADGYMHGIGELYDAVGNKIFTGRFSRDRLVYEQFLGQPTASLGAAFTTPSVVYNDNEQSAVAYPELSIIYEIQSNDGALDNEATVKAAYVYNERFKNGAIDIEKRADLDGYFGSPLYAGTSYLTFGEVTAIEELRTVNADGFKKIAPAEFSSVIDGVKDLENYDNTAEIYITTYVKDGILYTFYFEKATEAYMMYSMEKTTTAK